MPGKYKKKKRITHGILDDTVETSDGLRWCPRFQRSADLVRITRFVNRWSPLEFACTCLNVLVADQIVGRVLCEAVVPQFKMKVRP